MEKWLEIRKGGNFLEQAKKFGISPVTARIMRNRNVAGEEEIRKYLFGSLDDLEDPKGLTGIDHAADILLEKIRKKKPIRVIGDYDIDGVCATCILMKGLAAMGADISYDIPDRMTDGYGLNIRLVEKAVKEGIDTIVTVDNGISAASQVAFAREHGLTVVVTDHHEPPYEEKEGKKEYKIPDADAVVDPRLEGCPYPNKSLCGAGVAWKLIWVMEAKQTNPTGKPSYIMELPLTYSLLPFAAFATVGDVMDLTGENRILVRHGLTMLETTDTPGMRALIDACGLNGKKLSAYSIGFVLGPCINASGRLETARDAEKLFLTKDPGEAALMAQRLSELNQERRSLTDDGVKEALAMLDGSEIGRDRVLVLYLPGTHESIVGIIAGKVRERTGKPSFVLTDAQEAGMLKGSGRSIDEYSMFDEMVKCSDLLHQFGGHPMAAGLSLKKDNLQAFRRKINQVCTLTEDDIAKKIRLDMRLPLSWVNEDLTEDLERLEPFGKGNEKPLFGVSGLSLYSCRIMGARGNAAKLSVSDGTVRMTALYFGDTAAFLDHLREKGGEEEVKKLMAGKPNNLRLTCAYYPGINEFRGRREIQIIISAYM